MNKKTIWFGRYLGCNTVWINSAGKAEKIVAVSDNNFQSLMSFAPNRKLILKELKDIAEDELRDILIELKIDCFHGTNPTYNFNEAKKFILEVMSGETLNAPDIIEFGDCFRSHGFAIRIPKEYYITESELKEAK